MDFKIHRSAHRCAKTDRQLKPGEMFCSALVVEGADVVRYDYAEEAWEGPPAGVLGWWKSQVPAREARRAHWAPNDVMLDLFDRWAEEQDKQDMRYVLTLLLLRRRVLRLEETQQDEEGRERLVVYCPRREATYTVPSVIPAEARIEEIQDNLTRLLTAGPE
jgi:hypothetical protein